MPTLYVTEPGARVEKEYQRLLVTKADELLLRVPIQRVSQLVLVGNVGVTTPALHSLLAQDVPLLLLTRSGRLRGRLLPPTGGNLPLRQQQYRRNDDAAFCLVLTRAIVAAKIHNQRTLALRLCRRHDHIDPAALPRLKAAKEGAQEAATIDSLRGLEGAAARSYFQIYRQAFAADWTFINRNRRPPKDPINALLSLGYSLLTASMMSALEAAGLDPYLGYFHGEKYNRPALALDLVEPFRTPIVDSIVLRLINRRIIKADQFEYGSSESGMLLKPSGLKTFLRSYSDKLESEIIYANINRRISYRKIFEVEARQVARAIVDGPNAYTPFRTR
ncbi:MAG: CRISPR-associated endonuclease Cas1 [Chloroflexota bacterium]